MSDFEKCVMKSSGKTWRELFPKRREELAESEIEEYFVEFEKRMRELEEENPACKRKILIFRANETKSYGFGDRMRGLVTSFYIAMLGGLKLEFRMDFPNPLSLYFHSKFPHLWTLNTTVVPSSRDNILVVMGEKILPIHPKSFQREFAKSGVVELKSNYLDLNIMRNSYFKKRVISLFPFLSKYSRQKMVHFVLKIFLNPTPFLQNVTSITSFFYFLFLFFSYISFFYFFVLSFFLYFFFLLSSYLSCFSLSSFFFLSCFSLSSFFLYLSSFFYSCFFFSFTFSSLFCFFSSLSLTFLSSRKSMDILKKLLKVTTTLEYNKELGTWLSLGLNSQTFDTQ